MTISPLFRLRQLFDTLVELPDAQRQAFLAAQHDINATTRRQLQTLLDADSLSADLTARPAFSRHATDAQHWLGRRIGAYEIVRELGHGGMGSVFLAQRIDGGVTQQAAIKIVRPDMLDSHTLARFRLERQVLALLQHSNIAGMLDVGELEDGSPYAVMEYVDGAPITHYLHERPLALRDRLDLFLQVCDAVAYAHRNMIVHRDIKPGNVLVDSTGRPRLLDFGIAKPLLARIGTINVEETQLEQRFISLSHAAPEQLRGGAITAACDVYGLGALLYELLAGRPAFVLGERTPAQLEQEICEVDPPPPGRYGGKDVDRDLDLITLRCLRKQPADRYASVDSLADDVRRWLDGRPVAARRGNWLYRAGRFLHRHRTAVVLAGLLLVGALAGGTLLWRQQRATADQQSRADSMTSLIMDALASTDPNAQSTRDMTAREVFERVAAQAQASPAVDARSRARILAAVAHINGELGLPRQAEKIVAALDAQQLDAKERDALELLRLRSLITLGQFDQARAVLESNTRTPGDPSHAVQWEFARFDLDFAQGHVQAALDRISALDTATLSQALREECSSRRARALLALSTPDARKQAIEELGQLLQSQRARLGSVSPAVFGTLGELAKLESRIGNVEKADDHSTEMIAIADAMFSRNSMNYARALSIRQLVERARDNHAKAIALEQQALVIYKDQIGEISPQVAKANFNLASLSEHIGESAAAREYYRKAMDTGERVWLLSDSNVFLFRAVFADQLLLWDDCAESRRVLARLFEIVEEFPKHKESEIWPLAQLIDKVCVFRAAPSAAHRAAVVEGMREALKVAEGRNARRALAGVIEKAQEFGIEPPPEAAQAAAK